VSVTREDLEALIAEVRRDVKDPRAGIYGPASKVWEIQREGILFLGAGKASLLQLAHPWVAHGVDQYSATRSDPMGRFRRTFENVFGIMFGELDRVLIASRRVHAIHSHIEGQVREDVGAFRKGSRYEANDEDALLWVHATLVETAIQVYDLVVRPLDLAERDRYYQESKRFARLFGISDRTLPEDWVAFTAYYERMVASNVVRAGSPARDIAGFLFRSPSPVYTPLFGWLRVMTAGLLPERVRDDFGLSFGDRERRIYRGSLAALRVAHPVVPDRLRYVPPYLAALRRLEGRSGPDRFGRFLGRLTGLETPETRKRRSTRARGAGSVPV
jgi:uncharacterized protein (DUF2236 family)